MKTLPDTHVREASRCRSPSPSGRHCSPTVGPALRPHTDDTPFADERVIEQHIEAAFHCAMR
ncbi:TA system toxin CbtA family protein [Escherichia coli]|uniref:TA system toxin CbtA family protein n=1 Tax=Escherichia coli TaxID=562 RepID=UPI003890FB30